MAKLIDQVMNAIQNASNGIITLDLLKSLKLCDSFTLKTTLSRLSKSGRIIRLKRGTYSVNPIENAFIAAQATFSGYIGFSSALYLHMLIAEMPFSITVVTVNESKLKKFGSYEFRAVALKNKAVGFEKKDCIAVSTRAKTLFDCLYLEKYSIEEEKLIEAYQMKPLTPQEMREFDMYINKFIAPSKRKKFNEAKIKIKAMTRKI